ncbi:lasso peptide biosynthesis B2 protein [Clostridium akagii]|uniref:lasso peptide biosynthesis B2 protein n=1 Tax=Clostridium akagii TaxID=91623 RepID=UPI00047B470A|nr:lasso peptide biosynthesis B2 protein [Clostridium akagii]
MNLLHLPRKIKKIVKLSWNDKAYLFEAFFISGLVRFAILFVPFKKLASICGKYKEETTMEITDIEKQVVSKVAWAVGEASTRTPWESKCLVKALTAQRMLVKRKISSTVYLGLAKNENKTLLAHAWIRSGQKIITGEREMVAFKEVARFANYPRRNK